MIYGYARISTAKQDIARQIRNIQAVEPTVKIYEEVFTGTKTTGRNELKKLLKVVKSGDTIIFDSVSRMSRNADEGYELYIELFDDGINLIFINEPYINTDYFKEKLNNSIEVAKTGNKTQDKLVQDITDSLVSYFKDSARDSIRIAFEQAQKESDDLSTRTKGGIETARRNGKQIGRLAGVKIKTKKSEACKKKIKEHSKAFGGTLKDVDLIKMLGIDKNTYYKYKRELLEGDN